MVAGASPALVSSLLIHGDQLRVVRCLAFGQTIRCLSLSSHLSIGIQLTTSSSSPTLRFACAFTITEVSGRYPEVRGGN